MYGAASCILLSEFKHDRHTRLLRAIGSSFDSARPFAVCVWLKLFAVCVWLLLALVCFVDCCVVQRRGYLGL